MKKGYVSMNMKVRVKKLKESFDHLFIELLNNSIDSLYKAKTNSSKIILKIKKDIFNPTISITDNGEGFSKKNRKAFSISDEINEEDNALQNKGEGKLYYFKYFQNIDIKSISREDRKKVTLKKSLSLNNYHELDNLWNFSNDDKNNDFETTVTLSEKTDLVKEMPKTIEEVEKIIFKNLFYRMAILDQLEIHMDQTMKTYEPKKLYAQYLDKSEDFLLDEPMLINGTDFEAQLDYFKIPENNTNNHHQAYFVKDNMPLSKLELKQEWRDIDIDHHYYIIFISSTKYDISKINNNKKYDKIHNKLIEQIDKFFQPDFREFKQNQIRTNYLAQIIYKKHHNIILSNKKIQEKFADDLTQNMNNIIECSKSLQNNDFAKEKYQKLLESIETDKYFMLGNYIAYRKVILDSFKQAIKNGESEAAIHNLIMPRFTHSINKNEDQNLHNLWILDERLDHYEFLTSDKKIVQGRGGKPDLMLALNNNHSEGMSQLIIIEIKKSGRNTAPNNNPASQIRLYFDQIVKNKGKISFTVEDSPLNYNTKIDPQRTSFFGIVIDGSDDFKNEKVIGEYAGTSRLEKIYGNKKNSIIGFQGEILSARGKKISIQVIHREFLYQDAYLRNKPFFKKLGLEDSKDQQ